MNSIIADKYNLEFLFYGFMLTNILQLFPASIYVSGFISDEDVSSTSGGVISLFSTT